MENCIHVYYGTGKGKTTAAIGLAVRAAGSGFRVLFCQFMKSGETAELSVLQTIPRAVILRPQGRYPFSSRMTDADRADITAEHDRILEEIETRLSDPLCPDPEDPETASGTLVVMDELAWAFHYGLIDKKRALSLLDKKNAEFVITGRVAVPELLARADYITNLREEKHPFRNGIPARRGIEF